MIHGANNSSAVPDPYAIDDDDDIVMVDAADNDAHETSPPLANQEQSGKPHVSRSKSKRTSRNEKLVSSSIEDAVLVDADGPSSGGNAEEIGISSPQRSPKRSATKRMPTSTKEVAGGFMSLFGGFRRKERERRQSDEDDARVTSRGLEDEDSPNRRKRLSGGVGSGAGEEFAQRSRGATRARRRSYRASDTEGPVTDDAFKNTDVEDAGARKAQRRARRAEREANGEFVESGNRDVRRKDRERDRERAAYEAKKARAAEVREKRMREEQEYETRRSEERRARRAAREAEAKEADARDAERRARRRERQKEREAATEVDERPRSKPTDRDRHRSYNDKARAAADDDHARRLKHDERRLKRSSTTAAVPDKSSRSRAAPIEDYFDPRNSRNHRRKTSDNSHGSGEKAGRPYLPTGKDKTSSWVNSVNASPPLPPPVEGTVLDPPPGKGGPAFGEDEEVVDAAKRERRTRRRVDKEKERHRDEKVRPRYSSDGSGGPPLDRLSRRKTYHAPPMEKRGSWLQKIRGF